MMRRVKKELQTAQVSDLCRRRLLSYADSFYELARSYDEEFEPEQENRETVLMERRLWENRQIISGHLTEMAKIMTEAASEVLVYWPMEGKKRRRLVQALAEEGIEVESPCYLPREDGRQAVVLTMYTRRGAKVSAEDAADMISVLLDRRLAPSVTSPSVVETAPQSFVLEEEAAFLVLTGFSRAVKEGESASGDNYAVVEAEKGRVTVMLSDGTGSGEKAGRDSGRVLDLMEKMLEAGFETDMAVSLVNSALLASGDVSGRRNMSTLDICSLNLYQGMCVFRKVGAAASFLKSNSYVEQISLPGLPLGILAAGEDREAQEALRRSVSRELIDNDYIIMVSDGVLDALRESGYEDAMVRYLESMREQHPDEMAGNLLQFVLRCSQGRIMDDMTVLVLGVFDSHR